MKLPSPLDLVKPDATVLAVAVVSVVLTGLVLLLIVALTSQDRQRMDDFGAVTAQMLARIAVEPLMRQDRMHLGVLGNRLAELPQVTGVASYSTDNQLLATTGDLHGPQYTEPVIIDDSIVGYVRLALAPEAFARPMRVRNGALLIAMLILPLLIGALWSLYRSARGGAFAGVLPTAPAWWSKPEPAGDPITVPEPPEQADDIRHYLLAVNLYNQLSLPRQEREFELSLCMELAESVAGVYGGQVVALPGVGALLDFHHGDDGDRPFQVLCAAFVLARLLQDEAPFGTYRLGLNLVVHPANETLHLDHDGIADAALLSALAKDTSLALSASFAALLDNGGRVHTRPLDNPLLEELTTSKSDCRLATGLDTPLANLVLQQAEQLKRQRDTASSPSTF